MRATIGAGASPVRVVLSPGGKVAWVTARGSDALLGVATARLISARPALVADVPVGSAPVGVVLVDGGRLAVVADSNRFAGRGAQWLSVVSIQDAVHGRSALVGQIRAGSFPRQFALSPDGQTLYVTNFASSQLETIRVADLVSAAQPRAAQPRAAQPRAAQPRVGEELATRVPASRVRTAATPATA